MDEIAKIRQQIRFLFKQYKCIKDKGCLCFTEIPELSFNKSTKTLTSKYANGETASEILPFAYPEDFEQIQSDFNQTDITKPDFIKNKPTALSNFVNDTNFITIADIPDAPEYTYKLENNKLIIEKDGIEIAKIDFVAYLDDSNLPRIVSSTLNPTTRQVTFIRDDGSTFDLDLSSLTFSNTNFKLNIVSSEHKLQFLEGNTEISSVDLKPYLDDTNAPRTISGEIVDKDIVIKRDDNSSFKIDITSLFNSSGGSATNLSNTASPTGVTINSSTGTGTTIPIVTQVNAGLQKSDFYESGTYTPQAFTSDANGSREYTAAYARGNYIRIAGLVQFDLTISTLTSPADTSGSFHVTLPFTSAFSNSRPITYITDFRTGNGGTVIPIDKNFRTTTLIGNKLYFYWDGLPTSLSNVVFGSTGVTQIAINGIFQTSYTL